MKLLTKTILMSAMLLAACNKKSDPTPAQNNEVYWSELFGHELSDVSHAAFFCARKFS